MPKIHLTTITTLLLLILYVIREFMGSRRKNLLVERYCTTRENGNLSSPNGVVPSNILICNYETANIFCRLLQWFFLLLHVKYLRRRAALFDLKERRGTTVLSVLSALWSMPYLVSLRKRWESVYNVLLLRRRFLYFITRILGLPLEVFHYSENSESSEP